MGLLADVFSWGDKQKRRIRGLLDNPEDEARVFAHRSAETTRDFLMDPMNFIGGGLAGTFIGKGAKTWDKAMHGKALQMESAGMDPRAIWKETGNWKGPDGHWRQEIPDDTAAISKQGMADLDAYGVRAQSKLYPHPDIYAAYPDLAGMSVMRSGDKNYSGVFFGGKSPRVELGIPRKAPDFDKTKSINTHELQHGIQESEGWARGGNPDEFAREAYEAEQMIKAHNNNMRELVVQMDEAKAAGNQAKLSRLQEQYNRMLEMRSAEVPKVQADPFESYLRLAGEAEARATQKRMPMNAAQRREVFPADSYDVPIDQLIIRGLLAP